MIQACPIGIHIATNRLSIQPCIKVNRGLDFTGRYTDAVFTYEASVTWNHGGAPQSKAITIDFDKTDYDNVIDADYSHIHFTITTPNTVDTGSTVGVTVQVVTHNNNGVRLAISDPASDTYPS